jgi:hypothetical protein
MLHRLLPLAATVPFLACATVSPSTTAPEAPEPQLVDVAAAEDSHEPGADETEAEPAAAPAAMAFEDAVALLDRRAGDCKVERAPAKKGDQEMAMGMCQEEQLMWVLVGENVEDERLTNVDVLLGALMRDVKDLPAPQPVHLEMSDGSKRRGYSIVGPEDERDELAEVLLVDEGLPAGLRFLLCGWRHEDKQKPACLEIIREMTSPRR